MALSLADYAVTEAGFAFDLGGEKFFDLKCRSAGLNPAAVVIVATIRALKMHGGVPLDETKEPNPAAVERGLVNLAAHLDSAAHFGKPTVVAINQFFSDTPEEQAAGSRLLREPRHPLRHGQCLRRRGPRSRQSWRKRSSPPRRPRDAACDPLSAGLARRAEDRADRQGDVRGRGREHPASRRIEAQEGAETWLWPASHLHGQDAGLALGQSQAARAAQGFTVHVRDVEIAAGAGSWSLSPARSCECPVCPSIRRPIESMSTPMATSLA